MAASSWAAMAARKAPAATAAPAVADLTGVSVLVVDANALINGVRLEGVAEQVGTEAFAAHRPVHRDAPARGGEVDVERPPTRDGVAQHAAGMEDLVRDERRGGELHQVVVALLDDLDRLDVAARLADRRRETSPGARDVGQLDAEEEEHGVTLDR